MANTSIRTKEAIAQLRVDGVLQTGSFRKITTVSVDPDAELAKTRYVGDKRNRGDLDVMGYSFSFSTHVADRKWLDLWKTIEAAENAGLPMPTVTLTLTYSTRDGGSHTVGLNGDCVIKLDKLDVPENGYLVNQWSGYASFMT